MKIKSLFFYLCLGLFLSGCEKQEQSSIDTIKIAAVGDVNFGSDYPILQIADRKNRDFFRHCKKIFKSADISFCNLETVVCESGIPAKKADGKNTFVFRCSPEFVEVLYDAGIDVVSIANNHIRDFGIYGEKSTKKHLSENKIQYVSRDGEIAIFFLKGKSICFVGFTSGFDSRSVSNPDRIFDEIRTLSKIYDVLVVSFHAGAEGEPAKYTNSKTEYFLGENRGNPVLLAHGAVDNGADLILMHGPHVPRAVEIYKERFIAYSLGNFVNYGWNLKGSARLAPLLWIEIFPSGKVYQVGIYSFIQKKSGYPEFDRNYSVYKMIKSLTEKEFSKTAIFFNREKK